LVAMGNAACGRNVGGRDACEGANTYGFDALYNSPSLAYNKIDYEGCPCWLLLLLSPVLLFLSPLLLLQAIILFFSGCALFPLSLGTVPKGPVDGTFDLNTIPAQNPVPESLMNKTSTVSACCCKKFVVAQGSTEEMVQTTCEIMLKANVVSSTAHMPCDLQGIMWMKGNFVPEELACIAWGTAEATEPLLEGGTIVTRPNGYFGWTYLDSSLGKIMSPFDGNMGSAGMNYFCFDDAGLNRGDVFGTDGLDYSKLGGLYQLGSWTMERLPGLGVSWKRGCYWLPRWFGKRAEAGSYTLVKIMHSDGVPLQPAYDEFVDYMRTTRAGSRLMMEAPPL